MDPVTNNRLFSNLSLHQPQEAKRASVEKKEIIEVISKEENKMGLTDEGRALLAVLADIEHAKKEEEGDVADKVESFTYGVFGMAHPDEVKKVSDDSYSAGQYLKGALSVGSMLLAII